MIHRPLVQAGLAALVSLPLSAQNVGVAFDTNVDGYIEIPYTPQVVPQSGITVEAWFTYDGSTLPAGYRYPTLVRQGLSVGGSEDFFLRVNADNVGARVLGWRIITANGAALTCNYNFAVGEFLTWTHVAATYNGATSALYINGALVSSVPGNGQPIRDLNSEVLRIGKGSDIATPIEVWNGEIDEVRMWPFARTQGDIQATMNSQLSSVPGLVSTWNLNGNFTDSSSTLNATAFGQVTFTPNPLNLNAPMLAPALPAGASTPGCLGDLLLSPSGPATPGYADFGVICTRTPAGALTVWGASAGVLPAALPLLGVNIWIDPTGLVVGSGTADALGAVRAPIGVPATIPLGFAFGIQAVVLDICGPQLFTASNALTVVVQ